MQEDGELSLHWESITLNIHGNSIQYPLLIVKIWGSPGLAELLKFMKNINEATKNIDKDYISLTDFTHLDVSTLLETLMSLSQSLKALIGVKNPAKLSFVLLGSGKEMEEMKEHLEKLNTKELTYDYSYKYVFIKSMDELKERTEEILSGTIADSSA